MAKKVLQRVVVTVDDQFLEKIKSVATGLRSAGMQVDKILPTVGTVSGEIAQGKMAALKKVKGVASVEMDKEMQAI